MNRSIALSVILTLLIASVSFADETSVTIYFNQSHPPYNYIDHKEAGAPLKGIYIEIFKEIDRQLTDYQFVYEGVPWVRAKKLIEMGDAVAFMAPYYHGHDWPYVWPYSLPVMLEQVVLLCHKKIFNKTYDTWPDDFTGLTIGNNRGFDGFGGYKFRQFLKEGKIFMDESTKTTQGNLEKLLLGRTDCYMGNSGSAAWEIKKLKNKGEWDQTIIKTWGFISSDATYIGYTDRDQGKFPYKRDLKQKIDNVLYRLNKTDKIRRITVEFLESIGLSKEVIDTRSLIGN